jgi:preprotein translocase subunit YajC
MTGLYVMLGMIAAFVTILVVFDLITRRQQRKAGKQ